MWIFTWHIIVKVFYSAHLYFHYCIERATAKQAVMTPQTILIGCRCRLHHWYSGLLSTASGSGWQTTSWSSVMTRWWCSCRDPSPGTTSQHQQPHQWQRQSHQLLGLSMQCLRSHLWVTPHHGVTCQQCLPLCLPPPAPHQQDMQCSQHQLSSTSAAVIVQTLVICHQDYCNLPLYEVPSQQHHQAAVSTDHAARVVAMQGRQIGAHHISTLPAPLAFRWMLHHLQDLAAHLLGAAWSCPAYLTELLYHGRLYFQLLWRPLLTIPGTTIRPAAATSQPQMQAAYVQGQKLCLCRCQTVE